MASPALSFSFGPLLPASDSGQSRGESVAADFEVGGGCAITEAKRTLREDIRPDGRDLTNDGAVTD
jgi:hypothetical protein